MDSKARTAITAPQIFRFSDIDAFRSSIRSLNVDFTPLVKTISAEQTVLTLPDCELVLSKTFPRIVDAQISRNCTAIGFAMKDETPILFNGAETDKPAIALGRKGAWYSAVEGAASRSALIFFNLGLEDRGWPQTGEYFCVFETSSRAQTWLRALMLQIFAVTSGGLDTVDVDGTSAGIRESLFAGIDAAFADMVPTKWTSRANSTRQLKLFQDIRAALSGDLSRPIYSQELAQELGVSVRSMHDAVSRSRGISLHRYLRLRRLWLVRKRLLAGARSVKDCALAFGFWHLGDFARSYRSQFGESPTDTLKSTRGPVCLGVRAS
jgi:AraC family ethanolamine operon transcriptional activator